MQLSRPDIKTGGHDDDKINIVVVGKECRDFCDVLTLAAKDSAETLLLLMTLVLPKTSSYMSDMTIELEDITESKWTSNIIVYDDKENGDDREVASIIITDNSDGFWLQYDVHQEDFRMV